MKARTIRLMVTMFTLASVITMTGTTAKAQTVRSGNQENRKEVKKTDSDRDKSKTTAEKKSDFYTRHPSSGEDVKYNRESNSRSDRSRGPAVNRDGRDYYGSKPQSPRPQVYDRGSRYYQPERNDNRYESKADHHSYGRDRGHLNMDYRSSRHYYYHPRYGHIVTRFDGNPLLFTYNHGRLYYSNGAFFRYHSGIGYIVVDYPYQHYFDVLPEGAESVRFRGNVYFRLGNLFFELHRPGFRLVPFSRAIYSHYYPGEVYFSLRF